MTHSLSHGEGRMRAEAVVVMCGEDMSACIGGGDAPHIGAVALGIPRASLSDPAARSASASVLCVTGHKEDDLARTAALELATASGRRVCVCAGVHIDHATPPEIEELTENCLALIQELVELLADWRD